VTLVGNGGARHVNDQDRGQGDDGTMTTLSESPAMSERLDLLRRHMTAENAHDLDGTLATLTEDCLFDDRALGQTFPDHAGAAAYYRMWWDGFDVEVSSETLHWTTDGLAVAETRFRGRTSARSSAWHRPVDASTCRCSSSSASATG
jgi:hypothetical protein